MKLNFPQIDRHAQVRGDSASIIQLSSHSEKKVILWYENKIITHEDKLKLFNNEEFESLIEYCSSDYFSTGIYLGLHNNEPYFAHQLKEWHAQFDQFNLVNLRAAGLFLKRFHLGLLFYSQGLFNWHKSHQYCANCGATTAFSNAGHSRKCVNSHCGKQHFPRIEPAVIFSVVNRSQQNSRLLLARQASWDADRYSVLAGFVEAGESLENAVRREGMEEVGLVIDQVRYIASQPWPFPSSLMLGFECESEQFEFKLIDDEIEKAIWLTANELKVQIKQGHIKLPLPVSISWYLIERWYKAETGESLKSIMK